MDNYRIQNDSGFVRNLWCHRQEAMALWRRIGGKLDLYIVNPDGTISLVATRTPNKEEPHQPITTEPIEDDEPIRLPIRSWFATPTY